MFLSISEIFQFSPALLTQMKFTKKLHKDDHLKRPLNCSMLYSKHERAKVQDVTDKSEFSKILEAQWKALSPDEQKPYREESKSLDKLHNVQYPRYKYKPVRKARSAALKMKSSTKRSTVKTSTHPTFTNKKLFVNYCEC